MDKKIEVYQKEVPPLVARAQTIEIESAEDMIEATEILSQVNKRLDQMKAEKEKVLAPLREAANAEKARWKPLEDMFTPLVLRLRGLMGNYQTMMLKKQAEEQMKIASRIGDGKGKLKVETAIKKLGEMETVDAKIETEVGGLSFREKKQLKIVDIKLIPEQYWIVDEDAVFTALKEGTDVPGAEIEVVQVPVNKR